MDAVESLKEKSRMTSGCRIDCGFCPLSIINNGTGEMCYKFEMNHPAEAVRIVEEWSKAHPIQTNGQKFDEVFGYGPHDFSFSSASLETVVVGLTRKWWEAPYEAPKGADK